MLTKDRIDKHALQAVDCPPATWVVLRSAMHRLVDKESAACAERDARIAELERLRSEDHSHALDLAAEIERMTKQLEEARKDAKTFTDEQIDAAVKAWFAEKIIPGRYPFSKRMRAAIRAAIKEQT